MTLVAEFDQQLKAKVPSVGASWIKADFHLHTLGSYDHGYGEATYSDIALKLQQEGYRLVVVTDHNSLEGYEAFRKVAAEHGILALPGVELSVRILGVEDKSQKLGNRLIHLLAVFDPDLPDLQFALKTVLSGGDATAGVLSLPAKDASIERRTIEDVSAALKKLNALVIPAHLHSNNRDPLNSRSIDDVFSDQVFLQWVKEGLFDALEVIQPATAKFFDGKHSETNYANMPCLRSSDAHQLGEIGRRGTWLKMEELSFRNVKRALLDHEARVTFQDSIRPGYHRVLGLHVKGKFLQDAWFRFNPDLNCIIGPKGVGKSTAIECIRWALGFAIPEIPGLSKGKQKFVNRISDMMAEVLGPEATVTVLLQGASGDEYLVIRDRVKGHDQVSRVYQDNDVETVLPFHTEVFDVDYYGWEEIGNAAENVNIQLDIIDGHCGVIDVNGEEFDLDTIKQRIQGYKNRLGELVDKIIKVQADTARATQLASELAGLELWLKTNQSKQGSLHELETITKAISHVSASLNTLSGSLNGEFVVGMVIQGKVTTADAVKAAVKDLTAKLQTCPVVQAEIVEMALQQLVKLDASYRAAFIEAKSSLEGQIVDARAAVALAVSSVIANLESHRASLLEAATTIDGAGVQEKMAKLKAQQERYDTLQADLASTPLEQLRETERQLREEYRSVCRQLEEARVALSHLRRTTAAKMSACYSDIKVSLSTRSQWDDFADVLEETFKGSYLEKGWFRRLGEKQAFPERVAAALLSGDAEALQSLGLSSTGANTAICWIRESLNRLKAIHGAEVDDEPVVELLIDRDQPQLPESYRRADRLSSGQRSTALFPLITHGRNTPLIIDQPEDDLDNSYVYSYLVSQILRPNKGKRQFIFVTHNANIPVLGDAENIQVMDGEKGQGRPIRNGYIDTPEIVRDVTRVLEGSAEAFAKRTAKYGLGV